MRLIVADAVVSGQTQLEAAVERLRDSQLELILDHGAQRRQSRADFANVGRESGARQQHVFDHGRDIEMIVGAVQDRSRAVEAIGNVQAGTEVIVGHGQRVAVKAQAEVYGQIVRHLHLVLQVKAHLPAGFRAIERDWPMKMDAVGAEMVGEPAKAFVVIEQLLMRPQHDQIHATLHGVAVEKPCDVGLKTDCVEGALGIRDGGQLVVAFDSRQKSGTGPALIEGGVQQ